MLFQPRTRIATGNYAGGGSPWAGALGSRWRALLVTLSGWRRADPPSIRRLEEGGLTTNWGRFINPDEDCSHFGKTASSRLAYPEDSRIARHWAAECPRRSSIGLVNSPCRSTNGKLVPKTVIVDGYYPYTAESMLSMSRTVCSHGARRSNAHGKEHLHQRRHTPDGPKATKQEPPKPTKRFIYGTKRRRRLGPSPAAMARSGRTSARRDFLPTRSCKCVAAVFAPAML